MDRVAHFVAFACDIGLEHFGEGAVLMGEADFTCVFVYAIVPIFLKIMIDGDRRFILKHPQLLIYTVIEEYIN